MNNSIKSLPSNIRRLYLIHFFRNFFFVGGIVVPFLTSWGQLSLTQVMLIQSWYMFWIFILEVPSGTFVDCFGRKVGLMSSLAILVVSRILYGSYPSFYIFLAGEFLWAVAVALQSGTIDAFVYETLEQAQLGKQSKEIFARMSSIALFANLVATPLGGVIYSIFSARYAMLLSALPVLIALCFSFKLQEPSVTSSLSSNLELLHPNIPEKNVIGSEIAAQSERNLETTQKKNDTKHRRTTKSYMQLMREGLNYFKTHTILKILVFEFVIFEVVGYYLRWFYQAKLQTLGVDVLYLGLIHSGIAILQISILWLVPKVEAKTHVKKPFLWISGLILAIGYFLSAIDQIWTVIVGSMLGIAFMFSRGPILYSYMNKFIRNEDRATILSTSTLIRESILLLLNPLVGWLGEHYLNWTFLGLGMLTLLMLGLSKVEEKHLLD